MSGSVQAVSQLCPLASNLTRSSFRTRRAVRRASRTLEGVAFQIVALLTLPDAEVRIELTGSAGHAIDVLSIFKLRFVEAWLAFGTAAVALVEVLTNAWAPHAAATAVWPCRVECSAAATSDPATC
jgi:hypothetical protein